MAEACIKAIVSGKVQGVFFRDSTRQQAENLRLTGWVKNLPTGEVELIACGEQKNIDQLVKWLWQGPPAASVDDVKMQAVTKQDFQSFEVIR
jgi:acylphosphatase